MRALRGRTSGRGVPVDVAFFVQLGTPGRPPPGTRAARWEKAPVGRPPGGQGPLPPEGTKWFDFDITGHQRRKHRLGLVDRNAPRAAPRIWLRLCEGDRFDPTGLSYDAEFWLREARHLLHLAHNADAHMSHMYLWGGGAEVADEPQEEGERSLSVSESSPLQGGPWQGTCPPPAQGSKIRGSWGLLGAGCFHSMVLEGHRAGRGAETRAAGRRRILGGRGSWGDLATVQASLSV